VGYSVDQYRAWEESVLKRALQKEKLRWVIVRAGRKRGKNVSGKGD